MIDKHALHALSYGMYILSTHDGSRAFACVVNTLMQVTGDPVRVSFTLHKDNHTSAALARSVDLVAVVLSEDVALDTIGTFGFYQSGSFDKFASVPHAFDDRGIPYITEGIVARLDLRLVDRFDVGTHDLYLCDVLASYSYADANPMTYAYYQQVKRGSTPKRASSYIAPSAHSSNAPTPSASSADSAEAGECASPQEQSRLDTQAFPSRFLVQEGQKPSLEAHLASQDVESRANTPNAPSHAVGVQEKAGPVVHPPSTGARPAYTEGKLRIGWRCIICGYVEWADELPEGFTCPLCGVPRDMFEPYTKEVSE